MCRSITCANCLVALCASTAAEAREVGVALALGMMNSPRQDRTKGKVLIVAPQNDVVDHNHAKLVRPNPFALKTYAMLVQKKTLRRAACVYDELYGPRRIRLTPSIQETIERVHMMRMVWLQNSSTIFWARTAPLYNPGRWAGL